MKGKRNVYLSLGSNMGDREANIRFAINRLDEALGRHQALSDIVETEAWGFQGEPFLNAAVRYCTDRNPFSILRLCKRIERSAGRDSKPQYDSEGKRVYESRAIDIDILFCADERVDTPLLTIPHPLIAQRDFVKIPLSQILLPGDGYLELL